MLASFTYYDCFSSPLLSPLTDEFVFMGALIIQEVVKELLGKGLGNAKVLLLAGSRYMSVYENTSSKCMLVCGLEKDVIKTFQK